MYNSPKTSQWNDETVARLDALTKEGKSASQVAAIINAEFGTTFTRNAIIGKSHRVGLLCDGNTAMRAERKAAAQRRKAQAMRERSARSHIVRKVVRWGLGLKEIDTFPREAVATAHVPFNPKTIMQLDPGDCRWPCSGEGIDTIFCGGTTIDRDCSYCSRHVRLA